MDFSVSDLGGARMEVCTDGAHFFVASTERPTDEARGGGEDGLPGHMTFERGAAIMEAGCRHHRPC